MLLFYVHQKEVSDTSNGPLCNGYTDKGMVLFCHLCLSVCQGTLLLAINQVVSTLG